MKNMISNCLAISGSEVLGENVLRKYAYVESITIGEGHLDATDLIPTGSVKCVPLLCQFEPPIFAGFVTSNALRPGVFA